MKYKVIDKNQSEEVARLIVCLTNEIIDRTEIKHFDIDLPLSIELCEKYLSQGIYSILAAFDEDEIIGFGTICESYSIYAEGAYGIIQEFYIIPKYRSRNIGSELVKEIIKFAKSKEWKRIELCSPPIPEFERTVKFYQSNGFKITGGYKMKYEIT
ncbi:MAG: GNAT family N-acetyltransferase [Candidatus Sedimenticola sp. (ex Thyasira tokunagai)]